MNICPFIMSSYIVHFTKSTIIYNQYLLLCNELQHKTNLLYLNRRHKHASGLLFKQLFIIRGLTFLKTDMNHNYLNILLYLLALYICKNTL